VLPRQAVGPPGPGCRCRSARRQQLPFAAVSGGHRRRHIDAGTAARAAVARPGALPGGPGRIDEGGAAAARRPAEGSSTIEKGRGGSGLAVSTGPPPKHERMRAPPALACSRADVLTLEKIAEQAPGHQAPSSNGQPEQIAVAVSRIALVGEQTPHVEITPGWPGLPRHLEPGW